MSRPFNSKFMLDRRRKVALEWVEKEIARGSNSDGVGHTEAHVKKLEKHRQVLIERLK